jgi:hypothetical protein
MLEIAAGLSKSAGFHGSPDPSSTSNTDHRPG